MESFKPIRNKIRGFSYDSLTTELLSLLRKQELEKKMPSAFWKPLILLKWTLEFAEQKWPYKKATQSDIAKLNNMTDELEMAHDTFNLYKNDRDINKTLAILGSQQFFYQERADVVSFARQYILFTKIGGQHNIEAEFERLAGFTIKDFITFTYIIWMFIFHDDILEVEYEGYLTDDLKASLNEVIGKDKVGRIIQLLTVSRGNIASALADDRRSIRNYNLQPFEVSFFTRYPFLLFDNKHKIPHKAVIHHSANHFIYEFMKGRDAHFSPELGARMEKYMKNGLIEAGVEFKTEDDLRLQFGRDRKVVDYFLENQVLVEAKATELKHYTNVNPLPELLANEFRQTIVKAYAEQMLSVANALNSTLPLYGIVVTYKKLFLGNSLDMWESFLKTETLAKNHSAETLKKVPIENLFIIDIGDWDLLMQVIKREKISIVDVLEEAKKLDSNPSTKKFHFGMHLDNYNLAKLDLSYILSARDEITGSWEKD